MTLTMRYALFFFPLGLLLAGCAGSNRNEFGSAQSPSTASLVATDTASSVSADDPERAPRRVNRPSGETKAVASRYDITLDEIRGHVRNNSAVIIDARSPEDFSRGHVRGALNVPAVEKEAYIGQISKGVPTNQLIIIYCASPQCPASDTVYDYAASQGYTSLRVFKPGWKTLASENDLH